jgi:protein-S-isoprenylcysteine O-methyltransferase Ste14
MQWLELRVPPPVVMASVALLMWLVALLFPFLDAQVPARIPVAGVFVVIALVIGITALLGFRQAKTTVNPMKPEASSALVTAGIYQLSRNPMYLGMLLILAGWALVVSNLAALVMLPLFVLYLNRFQIGPEERALQARFGAEFEDYCRKVRRWL